MSRRIQQLYTLAEIKTKIASNDYSAELLLQHAMLLLENPAAVAGHSDLVTRESAMQAIAHVAIYNSASREREAVEMLVEAALAQAAPLQEAQARAVPLDEARRLFDSGWKAAARFCGREDVVADGIIGFGACPQFEAAFAAAHGIKGDQHA